MRRKLKIMTHQVDQLKEEISAKESALVKLHLEQQRMEKEKETLKVQVLVRKVMDQISTYVTHLRQASHSLKATRGREENPGTRSVGSTSCSLGFLPGSTPR